MRRYLTAVILLAIALPGCSSVPRDEDLALSGRIVDDVITLHAPRLTTSTPSPTSPGAVAIVSDVACRPGDRVSAGDEVMRFDDRFLKASVRSARASVRAAKARVGVLERMRADIGDRKTTVAQTRTQLRATIAELETTLADLRARRAQAAASLAELRRMLGSLPPLGGAPGGAPGGGAPALADPAELESAIARLDAAIARLESGLGRARRGLSRLDTASAQLSDASASLSDALVLARIAADASELSVTLAREQLTAAVVRAPTDGVVIEVPDAGETLAAGATAVRLRTQRGPRIEAWLGFEDLGRVRVGDAAAIRVDSLSGLEFEARVSRIGESAQYPPTYVATREVHLGRAVLVQLAPARAIGDGGGSDTGVPWSGLPPGTPCDVTFTTGSDRR